MGALANPGNRLALAGLVLAAGSMAYWLNRAENVSLPDNRILFLATWLLAIGLGIAAWVKKAGWLGRIASVPAILIGVFLTFTFSISEQVLPEGAIRVGDTIPAFSAVDENGVLFDSARLRGNPVLIKFFRAHW
ncbi:MAG: hypothetical protein AAGC67_10715 [Myxococcota bacterium]